MNKLLTEHQATAARHLGNVVNWSLELSPLAKTYRCSFCDHGITIMKAA